ncbi:MAG: GAF domain-containing sensor histidine kinase [Armatimonadetes bacterium]|nr:GAF domain-containing sensor histidine kinase [Armatimonadota bacterium]
MNDQAPLLAAVHLAARKLTGTGKFDDLLSDVLQICVEAAHANGGTIYLHDKERHCLQFRHVLPREVAERLTFQDIPDDYGVAGQVFQTRKSLISNFAPDDEERKKVESRIGADTKIATMITVPLMLEDEEPIGVVQLVNKQGGQFDASDAIVLDTVSAISTMAYLNSKLLDESTRASQLLGMGKVGHDIKNLAFALEANVSYSDYTVDSLRDDLVEIEVPEKIIEQVNEIDTTFQELARSIDRIKRYSILMSDLSAGKTLEPSCAVGPMAEAIRMGAAFLESEARAQQVRMVYDIQEDAPMTKHDEMYVFRIAQNLVSNAVKAVAETVEPNHLDSEDDSGWKTVTVRYKYSEPTHIFEVVDQGPGMKAEVAERILAGTARSFWGRSGGSGWGTKIVLELAATHQGKVSIDSEVGKGSTFRIEFPHVPE